MELTAGAFRKEPAPFLKPGICRLHTSGSALPFTEQFLDLHFCHDPTPLSREDLWILLLGKAVGYLLGDEVLT